MLIQRINFLDMYVSIYVCTYVCMYVYMYLPMHVCMYVRMSVCLYASINLPIYLKCIDPWEAHVMLRVPSNPKATKRQMKQVARLRLGRAVSFAFRHVSSKLCRNWLRHQRGSMMTAHQSKPYGCQRSP